MPSEEERQSFSSMVQNLDKVEEMIKAARAKEEKVENLLNNLLPTLERIELHLYNISEHLLAMRRL